MAENTLHTGDHYVISYHELLVGDCPHRPRRGKGLELCTPYRYFELLSHKSWGVIKALVSTSRDRLTSWCCNKSPPVERLQTTRKQCLYTTRECIVLQLQRSEVRCWFHWAKLKVSMGMHSFLEVLEGESLPWLLQLRRNTAVMTLGPPSNFWISSLF